MDQVLHFLTLKGLNHIGFSRPHHLTAGVVHHGELLHCPHLGLRHISEHGQIGYESKVGVLYLRQEAEKKGEGGNFGVKGELSPGVDLPLHIFPAGRGGRGGLPLLKALEPSQVGVISWRGQGAGPT